jgi:ABC-type nitrate/sulfonate/bicarbonate transport system permease component
MTVSSAVPEPFAEILEARQAVSPPLSGAIWAGLLILGTWTLLTFLFPPYLFPSIPAVLQELWGLFHEGRLLTVTLSTVRTVLVGSVLAVLLGLLGAFILLKAEEGAKPLVNFMQTVPNIVWALLAVVWFGLTSFSVVFVILMVGTPIVALNTWEGLKGVDRLLLEMTRTVNASRPMTFRHLTLPSILPYLLAAIRVMVGFSWKVSVLAELITGNYGIGQALFDAWEKARIALVFGWTVWLVGLMFGTEYLLIRPLELRMTRWRRA